jgi:hypothetical protein
MQRIIIARCNAVISNPQEGEKRQNTKCKLRLVCGFQLNSSAALKGKRPETDTPNIDGLRGLDSEFVFEELLVSLEGFGGLPPHAGISAIENEFRRRVRYVEEKILQLKPYISLLQQEVGDLRGANARLKLKTWHRSKK